MLHRDDKYFKAFAQVRVITDEDDKKQERLYLEVIFKRAGYAAALVRITPDAAQQIRHAFERANDAAPNATPNHRGWPQSRGDSEPTARDDADPNDWDPARGASPVMPCERRI